MRIHIADGPDCVGKYWLLGVCLGKETFNNWVKRVKFIQYYQLVRFNSFEDLI